MHVVRRGAPCNGSHMMAASGVKGHVNLSSYKGIIGNITLLVLSVFVSSLLLDRVLVVFGLPSQPPVPYSHPAGVNELRRNIEFAYRFTTNSYGLRDDDIPLAKPPGNRRIFVVGDSFAEGTGVEVSDRFTEQLEGYFQQAGREVSFINGGLAGRGPLEYARVLLNVGLGYDVDGVLIVLYANDVADTPPDATPVDITSNSPVDLEPYVDHRLWRRAIQYLWPRVATQISLRRTARQYRERTRPDDFVEAVSHAAARAGITPQQVEQWKARLPASLVEAANRGVFNGTILSSGLLYPARWTDSLDVDTTLAERKWQAMASILSAVAAASTQRGLEVGVVFLPASFQYDPASHSESSPWVGTGTVIRRAWLSGRSEFERRLQVWATERAIPFLSLTDSFREAAKTQSSLTWPLDGHWTPQGHRVASLAIYRWMTTNPIFRSLGAIPAT